MAAVTRGSAREIVLVNRTRKTARAVATDMRYGTPLVWVGAEDSGNRAQITLDTLGEHSLRVVFVTRAAAPRASVACWRM